MDQPINTFQNPNLEQNQQAEQLNQPIMSQPQRKWPVWLTITIVAIVVVAVAGAGWWYWNKNYAIGPTPTPTAIPDETANWKTYTNTQYGFEFKYPNDWILKDGKELGISPMFNYIQITKNLDDNDYERIEFTSSQQDLQTGSNTAGPQIDLGGMKWSSGNFNNGVPGQNAPHDSLALFTKSGSTFYEITLYPNDTAIVSSDFSQILSTFKFIGETANWKTYTNTQYGFEVKYPNSYQLRTMPISGSDQWINTYFGWQAVSGETILVLVSMPDIYPGTDFDAGSFIVSVTNESQSHCGKLRQGDYGQAAGTVTVSGVVFSKTQVSGAGLGHQGFTNIYAGWHNNKCIIISTDLQTSGYGGSDAITSQINSTIIFSALDKILSTFKFTR